jgi:cytochrome P450
MSTNAMPDPRAIADLPELSEIIADPSVAGFPDDFADLFGGTQARLLRITLYGQQGVMVFRNKDLREMAANPAVGMAVEHGFLQRLYRNQVFASNPPVHGPMRQVIARPLSPVGISSLVQLAKRVAAELIDEVVGRREIDFYSHFSERFTARFWGAVFEMTDGEVEHLTETVRATAPVFSLEHTPARVAAFSGAMDRYLDTVAEAIHRALDRGGNELLTSMAAGFDAVEGDGKPERLGEMIAANVYDGLHTVAVAGGNILYQLLLARDDLLAVRADPVLLSNAVTEGLRLWTPLIYTGRCALRDLEFSGTLIPRGTQIIMLWAAGNRDPGIFENPDRYDLFRTQQDERTFGGGVHICPGRYMVRMLTRTMLEAVLAPDIRIELTGDRPTWLKPSSLRQLNRLQVAISRDRP